MADNPIDPEQIQSRQRLEDLLALTDSPGWKYLLNRLREDRTVALEELVVVNPGDAKAIIELQAKALAFDYFLSVAQDLIEAEAQHEELEEGQSYVDD